MCVYHIALCSQKCNPDRLRDVILHQEASYRDGWPNELGKDLTPSENGLAGIKAMDSGACSSAGRSEAALFAVSYKCSGGGKGGMKKDAISKQDYDVIRLHCQL
jgi:hypothetical protein